MQGLYSTNLHCAVKIIEGRLKLNAEDIGTRMVDVRASAIATWAEGDRFKLRECMSHGIMTYHHRSSKKITLNLTKATTNHT